MLLLVFFLYDFDQMILHDIADRLHIIYIKYYI